jgi:hypothetical protein
VQDSSPSECLQARIGWDVNVGNQCAHDEELMQSGYAHALDGEGGEVCVINRLRAPCVLFLPYLDV